MGEKQLDENSIILNHSFITAQNAFKAHAFEKLKWFLSCPLLVSLLQNGAWHL
jgi:hypothetical protein